MQLTVEKTGMRNTAKRRTTNCPLKFHLTEADTQAVFGLAEKLEHFKNPLESQLKVAFMGKKTSAGRTARRRASSSSTTRRM